MMKDAFLREDCSKCGAVGNDRFEYHAPGSCSTDGGREHLHYDCFRCGYDWTGPTLDRARADEKIEEALRG